MMINPQAERAFYDKQKEGHGGSAAIVWIVSGLFLFFTTPGTSLFSVKALLFIVVGMFAAAIVLGGLTYLVQRGIAAILVRTIGFPGPKAIAAIQLLALILFVVNTAITVLAARFVFRQITAVDEAASSKAAAGQMAWIVLTFTDTNGKEAQMSFSNPDRPSNLADCGQLLPSLTDTLVKKARQAVPLLPNAAFKAATCIASKEDPLKPGN